ncbi:MAG TPA: glycosyltransferase family 2 protein [Candidatus Nanopelagicaceae bacterium]|nr:glycosyltransferase family 2 protein [Candidatus Nanopelagicaceae bacterium]
MTVDFTTPVSVIMPVLNEAPYLQEAVAAVLAQDYLGSIQVVLAMGPSKDHTDQIAQVLAERDKRIILVTNPSGRTPTGLNLALAAATGQVIVRVDGHTRLPADYISTAVQVLAETGAVNVGGVMAAEGVSAFEQSVASAMRSSLGVGSARFHTGGEAGPVETVYLGVFLRSALDQVNGYDERFIRAQDWELNFRLRKSGGLVFFTPKLSVTYRPRSSIRALARQYLEYGRWRRAVIRANRETVTLRYLVAPAALLGVLVGLLGGVALTPLFFVLPGVYLAFLVVASVSIRTPRRSRLLLPLVLSVMQMSWGLGFLTSSRKLLPKSVREFRS